jgi:hypothetical protein
MEWTEGMPAHDKFWRAVMESYWRVHYFDMLFIGDGPHDLVFVNAFLEFMRQDGRMAGFVRDLAEEMGVSIEQFDVGKELEKIDTVEELLNWMNSDENTRMKW